MQVPQIPGLKKLGSGTITTLDKQSMLYGDFDVFKAGEGCRYIISVDPATLPPGLEALHLRCKNSESSILRPIYIAGPYSFYIDIRPINYTHKRAFNEPIQFYPDVKPNQVFKATLNMNENSLAADGKYRWIVDIQCQMSMALQGSVPMQILLGTDGDELKRIHRNLRDKNELTTFEQRPFISVEKLSYEELWNLPPRNTEKPAHAVFVTHGIFSNVGCDMLYLKESIENAAHSVSESVNSNVVVRGYNGNVGKSHKGIKWLGRNLALFVVATMDDFEKRGIPVDKVSFVGHSLGGPVQSFAIYYICIHRPEFFIKYKPVNFVTLASPYLGVIGGLPVYLSWFLEMGALGKTGRDLNLKHDMPKLIKGKRDKSVHQEIDRQLRKKLGNTPILEAIPSNPALKVFESFLQRTCYANVVHDGIVPLRTSALLYLDWKGLDEVKKLEDDAKDDAKGSKSKPLTRRVDHKRGQSVGEIPELSQTDEKKSILNMIFPQFSTSFPALSKNKQPMASKKHQKRQGLHKSSVPKAYQRSQTLQFDQDGEDEVVTNFSAPPQANAIVSAASTVLADLPSQDYIMNPDIRDDCIFHDKVYLPSELPPAHYKNPVLMKKIVYPFYDIYRTEEKIARSWQETMTWRKVLVRLQPDSHNNISVRRRFVNSFGWVAVDHMADAHFGQAACETLAAF